MFYEWDFFQHSAPEVISTAQFSVQFCSEIGLINDGISQKLKFRFWSMLVLTTAAGQGLVSE